MCGIVRYNHPTWYTYHNMVARSTQSKKPLQPDELGALYPTPKTYDDIQADTEARQEYYDTLRTKFAAFKIAFFGTILFAPTAYYASNVEMLWQVADVAVIAFSYGVWLILFLFAIKWLRYTANIFYEYSSPIFAFWILYTVGMAAALFAWQQGLWLASTDYRWLGVLTGTHYVISYVAAKVCIKK